MVNWDAEDVKEFKKEARMTQQEYCDLLGDREWDVIEACSWTTLRRKVGFGIFGPPGSTPSSDNLDTGYTKEQVAIIEKICDKLVESLNFHKNIHFACIFVVMKVFEKRSTVPVFRAKNESDSSCESFYVDTCSRKYKNWEDYLSNNTLQKCIYCYPTYGKYENNSNNEVIVSFGTSPACDLTSRICSFFDVTSTVVTVAATGVGVAALCAVPIAGPILAASAVAGVSTSAYGVTRSSYALYDRATHSQSIGLDDAEARGCWLSIVGSSLGFAQGRMIASMSNAARAGEVMGKAGRIAFMIVQTGSLTINGIGIVHGLAVLVDKSERNELTPLDVFQFSASILFFTNSLVNCKTASTIIKEVQHDVIQGHREGLSKDARKVFNQKTGKLRGPDEMHGNAKVVKQLNKIENSKDLFEMMADRNVASHKVKLTPDGFKGLLEVNKNLKIHPLALVQIPPEARQAIFDSTKRFASGDLSRDKFHNEMKTYCREYRISFETMREDTLKKLCQMYGKENVRDIKVAGRKIFATAKPHEVDRLRVVLENTAQNNESILAAATEFANTKNCASTGDFIAYTEFFVSELNDAVKAKEMNYRRDLSIAKEQPGFKQATFDEHHNIPKGVKRIQHFREKTIREFSSTERLERLNERFNHVKDIVAPLNQNCQPSFLNDNLATYHYVKHRFFGKTELTAAEYFQVAEEVFGNPTNQKNAILSQDGNCVMITYECPQRGVRAIKIDRQGTAGIATVMYDERILRRD